jgi:hypothetical protein
MRLPQSILRHFSVRPVHFLAIGIAIVFLGIVPMNASATSPQLACTPSSLRFRAVVTGQTETLLVTVTNNGATSVTITNVTSSNPAFVESSVSLPLVLPAGQSLDLRVSFTPTALGSTGGTIQFSSNASNPTLQLELGGAGVSSETLTARPATVSFGQVAIGSSSTVPIVLTNDRSWNVTLSSAVQISGSGFSVSGPTLPVTLASGQSVTVNVTFKPQSAGLVGGSVLLSGPPLAIPLTGTGTSTGQLGIAPAPVNFGNVPVGTMETQPLVMSATGGSVTVSSAGSSSSQFVLNGASFPFTIPAGQSLSFNVAFTPQSSGTVSGTLTFLSNASNSQAIESLTGVGTATPYSVNLFWNSAADVVGYNVYRSTAANGTYSKINSSLNTNTAYTDTAVASGQTYYYAATSVNSVGQESPRSTPSVQAVVP